MEQVSWYYKPFNLRSRTKSRLVVPLAELNYQGVEKDLTKDYKKKTMFDSPSAINLVLIVAALFCILPINVLKKRRFVDLESELMVLVFVLVSRWATAVVIFSIERRRNYFLTSSNEFVYFLYRMRSAVQNCVWLALVLMVWECDFREGKKMVPYVSEILWCLLWGNLIWLSKNLFVKVLGLSFHVSAFLDRIQESLFDQYVIEAILKEDENQEQNCITSFDHSLMNEKNISAWNMKRMMKIVKNELTSNVREKITSDIQANATARNIFWKVINPKTCYLQLEDLNRFMGKDEASKAMSILKDGPLTQFSGNDFQIWMVNAFRERRALVMSLIDTKTAVKRVDQMLNVPVGILVVVIWLHIFKFPVGFIFILLSFQFLLWFFVFEKMCMETFKAIVFYFVVHPFDVGDTVLVDGVQMTVEKMNILTTVFLKYDEGHKIYYLNSDLLKKPIKNYRRSPKKEHKEAFCKKWC